MKSISMPKTHHKSMPSLFREDNILLTEVRARSKASLMYYANTGKEQIMKLINIMILWMVTSFIFTVETNILRFSMLCARTKKGIRQTLNNIPISIPKTIQTRYNFHTRKSDANNKEPHRPWEPKWVPQTENNRTKMHTSRMTNNLDKYFHVLIQISRPRTTKKPYQSFTHHTKPIHQPALTHTRHHTTHPLTYPSCQFICFKVPAMNTFQNSGFVNLVYNLQKP